MRALLITGIILFFIESLFSQSSIEIKVKSVTPGDSFTVIIQKSVENFYQKKIYSGIDSIATYKFNSISNGKWAVKFDATGYYFPPTQVVDLIDKSIIIETKFTKITLSNSIDYIYKWQDDSSYLGHTQQSYINGELDLKLLGNAINIPDDFSSVNLINTAGIALSNNISIWTSEDAYRLYQMVKRVPLLNTNKGVLSTNSININSIWSITDEEVIDDISVKESNGIKYVKISRKAFVYATPLIAELDGIKGRFFSKRLYNAIIAFATNYGTDSDAISKIANQNFGIKFLDPGNELKSIMNEDPNNFQSFSAFEKLTILSMFEELPSGMHVQPNLKYIVRRIAGQDNPKYPNAAAIAWIGFKTIEFMQKAFNTADYGSIQRLILHEKSHFLWVGLFEQKLKDDWAILGGWYNDPTSPTGWSTTKTTEFVSAYGHGNNPDEDMAETIATYVTNPNLLMSRSIRKFEFIRDRVMHGTRYVSLVRKDLTFMVYNLYPDYNYPGKIKGVTVNVVGDPNQDKKLSIEIKLHAIDSARDGASYAFTRISSSIGTFFDMYLNPVNGNPFLLRGEIPITKFAKNGYWTVNQIIVADAVGNKRYENNNTFGLKIFINNPLEDLLPAKYKEGTLSFSTGKSKFGSFQPYEIQSGKDYQFLQSNFDVIEKNEISYIGVNFAIPTKEKGVNRDLQFGVLSGDTNYVKRDIVSKDLFHITYRYPIPEYYPTGFYKITQIFLRDEAQNEFRETFMNDTSGYKVQNNQAKHLRDSIYITTKYPDFLPPILDLNAISINATPTNPKSPDGETLFEMEFFVKDTSDYPGFEAGVQNGYYVLRDPQGKQFGFSMQADFDGTNGFYYLLEDPSGKSGSWRKYKVKTLLPKGSAPGLWGVESISLNDRAQNSKFFNFVEIVRFDIEESDSLQKVIPKVEILSKKVNSKNVDSVSFSISCKSCSDKIYRARFYSDMGGESVVKEGVMTSDSITVNKLKLSGINDGVLFATVFILDTSRNLLGIGKSSYTKDVIPPKSSVLSMNLSNFGASSIDTLVLSMSVSEIKGEYIITLNEKANTKDSLRIKGVTTGTLVQVKNLPLKDFKDGVIELKSIFVDSVGNESVVSKINLFKDTKNPELSIIKQTSNGLKIVYSLNASEYLSNTLQKNSVSISNGTIDSLNKVNNSKYQLYVTKSCNDTTRFILKPGSILDTVGNKNSELTVTFVDSIVPNLPVVTNLSICQGTTGVQLTATALTNGTLLWYSTNATGGTSSSTPSTINTSTSGIVSYYVSQIYNTTSCESQRAKIVVTVKELPLTPIIKKDMENYLVSSSSVNTWYKDGVKIADTTQKIKPTSNGIYTATTTQNGCTSSISQGYYYLTNAVSNLSNGEYFKFSPNPTSGELNINYRFSSNKDVYISVIDINGRNLILNKKINSGSKVNLGSISKGNYIIQVKDKTGRLITSQKLVKE